MNTEKTISKEEQPVEQEQKQKQSENPTDAVKIQKKEHEEIKNNKKAIQYKKRGKQVQYNLFLFASRSDTVQP